MFFNWLFSLWELVPPRGCDLPGAHPRGVMILDTVQGVKDVRKIMRYGQGLFDMAELRYMMICNRRFVEWIVGFFVVGLVVSIGLVSSVKAQLAQQALG